MTQSLNSIMEMDHVVRVREDGVVENKVPGFHAPEVILDCDNDGQVLKEHEREMIRCADHQGWTLLTGWTMQSMSWGSPLMHASESVGGALEEHIRGNPGLYVCTVPSMMDDRQCDGWVIAFREYEDESRLPWFERTPAPGATYPPSWARKG